MKILVGFLIIGLCAGYVGYWIGSHPSKPFYVEQFMHGTATGNGTEIWSSYPPDVQDEIAKDYGSKQAAEQDRIDFAARMRHGVQVYEYHFMGGIQLAGHGEFIYWTHVVTLDGRTIDMTWHFITDENGMVAEID